MSPAREVVYSALFARAAAAFPWKTASRQLVHWTDVPASAQPALFQSQSSERSEGPLGANRRWNSQVNLYVYTHRNGGAAPSATQLNAALDGLTSAFEPANGIAQNLGGLVQWCRVNGTVEIFEGTLGDQSVAIVPVEFVAIW